MNVWLLVLSMLVNSNRCEPVHADQISGIDLARALPAFSAMPGDAIAGMSPAPGTRRLFAYPELERIGKKYGIEIPATSRACFEWKMRPLAEEAVRAAIRESLQAPEAQVVILALGKTEAPEGKLVFPLSGLSAATNIDPATPVTWRGEVVYHSSHKYPVWARVRVSASMTRVTATDLLLPGRAITAQQVRLETLEDFPLRTDVARNLDEVVGRTPLRAIQSGAPVQRSALREPFQVQRGETVQVTAVCGAAQLTLEAVAENPGKQGDLISLRNPVSGKMFRARVEGHDKALVISGPIAMLAGVQ